MQFSTYADKTCNAGIQGGQLARPHIWKKLCFRIPGTGM